MYKALDEYRARQAKEHEAWYRENAKERVRFFPFGTDWAEAAESMTDAERKFYKVHIEKSLWIKGLIDETLVKM